VFVEGRGSRVTCRGPRVTRAGIEGLKSINQIYLIRMEMAMMTNISHVDLIWQEVKCEQWKLSDGRKGGFTIFLGGGAPLRNDVTIQDFS